MARRKSENQRHAAQRVFLDALADGATVVAAAKAANTSKTTVYQWRAEDAAFAKEWAAAYEAGGALLEHEAHRRAVEGVLKPIYHQGKKVGTVREYSDTLLIFLMKSRNPRLYCDRVRAAEIEREIADAMAKATNSATVTAADVLARLERLAADKARSAVVSR